ncbi:MAG: DUF2971 domain-containing protein [Bacteroidia bacterium]
MTLSFNNFTYIAEHPFEFGKNVRIEFEKDIPDSLYKYYSPNNYNFTAIANNEFYCSHPFQFNDLTDCTPYSYDFSDINFEDFKTIYINLSKLKIEEIEEMYHRDKAAGFKEYRTQFYMMLTQHLGILCLSENEMHNLMWGYYASDAGFKIKFKTDALLESINDVNGQNVLFFPINYIDNKLHIDINKYGSWLPILLEISTKVKHWQHEHEWRIVMFKNDMDVPNSLITPSIPDYNGKDNRFIKYNPEAVEEIVFGMNFFNGKIVKKSTFVSNTEIHITVEDFDVCNFLDFVALKLVDKVYHCGIFTDRENLIFDGAAMIESSIEKIIFTKLAENLYSINRNTPESCLRFQNEYD